ncbi:MAG: hypothetical protein HFI49_01035, partial [Bacilli bacterium]|nr:hypothetical protein [Bacilli bacterium]
ILFILFISACITIFYLLNNKQIEISKDITGTVIIADKEYLMIESNKENYLIINIKGDYEVGDKVKFTYFESETNIEKTPKEIKIRDEELIEKNKTEIKDNETENKDHNINENVTKPSNNNSNENTINKPNTNNEKLDSADITVMNYMNTLEVELNKPSLGESVKESFITLIDFIFYKGSIKGHTFNELSNSVKLKVLSSALYLDSKIDKYFPGYKESISSATKNIYTNVKTNIISVYLDITTTICNSNNELCDSAKDGFQSLKKNFGLTFDLIKEIAGDGISNLKNWYEIWSGK